MWYTAKGFTINNPSLSIRQDREVEVKASFLKESVRRYRSQIDKHSSTAFPSLADKLEILAHKKPQSFTKYVRQSFVFISCQIPLYRKSSISIF